LAILPILTAGDPRLRDKARKVRRIDDSVRKLIDDMAETMRVAHGVGLAATQVGVPLRVVVIEMPAEEEGEKPELKVLVNPQIVRRSREVLMDEACLSVPGFTGEVKRHEVVTVKALDRTGKEYRIKGEGLLAQALQHEMDHLDGRLYVDFAERVETPEEKAEREGQELP
jgi:peptide deformylase